ncbi:MAG: helix-turn-helix domain-containing protein [Chloroflexota bacterium]
MLKKVTSAQIRAARGLLNWTVRDLAEKSGVHHNTITRAEANDKGPGYALSAICDALEMGGVIFVDSDDEGPGVRLKKKDENAEGQ